jgi:hypothetical protein
MATPMTTGSARQAGDGRRGTSLASQDDLSGRRARAVLIGEALRKADQVLNRRLEVVTAAIISAAALATSWSGYQAALWNRQQATHYSRAGGLRTMSTREAIDASVTRSVEVGLFSAWLDAKQTGNEALATFYAQRFPADLKPAFADWIAQDPFNNIRAARSPFELASYQRAAQKRADLLEAKANSEFSEGQAANSASDDYTLITVILASSLFFGGISRVFSGPRVRLALTLVAMIACAVGLVQLLFMPVLTPR